MRDEGVDDKAEDLPVGFDLTGPSSPPERGEHLFVVLNMPFVADNLPVVGLEHGLPLTWGTRG